MEKAKRPASINLLPEDEFSQSLLGKFFLWSLSVGRYIVIFTELIVILSFLSRFKLDRDLTDLNEAIARQKAIITSYGDLEVRFRAIQQKLELISQADAAIKPDLVLTMLNQTTPPEIRFDQVDYADGQLSLSGTALSSSGLDQLISNFRDHPLVESLNVGTVSSQDGNNSIEFSLAVVISQEI